jgi:hypothetical protein
MDRIVRDGIPLRKLARIIHEVRDAKNNERHACGRPRAGEAQCLTATRMIRSVMPVRAGEVHDAMKKARHVCGRPRDVSRPCPVIAQCLRAEARRRHH